MKNAINGYNLNGYALPKSLCTCEHTGDGKITAHAGMIGHGKCLHPECGCTKFTWKRFLPAFLEHMKILRGC